MQGGSDVESEQRGRDEAVSMEHIEERRKNPFFFSVTYGSLNGGAYSRYTEIEL